MRTLYRLLPIALLAAAALPALADDDSLPEPARPGYQLPSPDPVEPNQRPDVVEYQEGSNTIREYRVRGQLLSIQVMPKHGRPYFLKPADGSDDAAHLGRSTLRIPQWTVFSW